MYRCHQGRDSSKLQQLCVVCVLRLLCYDRSAPYVTVGWLSVRDGFPFGVVPLSWWCPFRGNSLLVVELISWGGFPAGLVPRSGWPPLWGGSHIGGVNTHMSLLTTTQVSPSYLSIAPATPKPHTSLTHHSARCWRAHAVPALSHQFIVVRAMAVASLCGAIQQQPCLAPVLCWRSHTPATSTARAESPCCAQARRYCRATHEPVAPCHCRPTP